MNQIGVSREQVSDAMTAFTSGAEHKYFEFSYAREGTLLVFGREKYKPVMLGEIQEKEKELCKKLHIAYPHCTTNTIVTHDKLPEMFSKYLEDVSHETFDMRTDETNAVLMVAQEAVAAQVILDKINTEHELWQERYELQKIEDAKQKVIEAAAFREKERVEIRAKQAKQSKEPEIDPNIDPEDRPLNMRNLRPPRAPRGSLDSLPWPEIIEDVEQGVTLYDLHLKHGASEAGLRYRLKKMNIL